MAKKKTSPNKGKQTEKDFPLFRERLKALLKEKKLSRKKLGELVGCSDSTINTYLIPQENDYGVQGYKAPSVFFITKAAPILGVSTDYLLGLSDFRTPEADYIGKETGLNDKAIALLKYRKENEDKPKDRQDNLAADLSMISNVLCSSGFDRLIAGIYNYIYLDYNVPVFHTGNEIEIDGKPYLEMKAGDYNQSAEKYLIHFAKDRNNLYDHEPVVVDKDFLETAASNKIKKALDIIKADILDRQKRGLL